jgi:hypothetical protein
MPDPDHKPLTRAEYGRVLVHIAGRAMLTEYDRSIIRNARQVIQRSRELLEATKHQVRPPV